MKLTSACSAALLALLSFAASAQSTTPPPSPASGAMGRPHGPPPEAIQACSGKAANAACSFTGRRGETLSGTCSTLPAPPNATAQSTPALACRPANMPADGPPPGGK